MKLNCISCLILASFAAGSLPVSADQSTPLYFNTTPPKNDLTGSLAARVQFAQSQILPVQVMEGDRQPHLTSLRRSLLLVQPLQADNEMPMFVDAHDGSGKLLGSLPLSAPSALPKTVYHSGAQGWVNFIPDNGTTVVISSDIEVRKLGDKNGTVFKERITGHSLMEIKLGNGHWAREIYLPQSPELEGKMVRVSSSASWNSILYYGNRQVNISAGKTQQFKFVNAQWFLEGELENDPLSYAPDTWSGELPGEWIAPGLSLSIRQGNLNGVLSGIKVGAPGELLLHTIDMGMLTPPQNRFTFAKDNEAQREYFQTIPASRMIVNQYAPLYLQEVMLPSGTLLTDLDPSQGGIYSGDMRGYIGKLLISHGINNANYGINSTAGSGETSHPFIAVQLTAHNNIGKYANGIQVHGLSGGAGMVTLKNSLGNEFSHEVGHNYALGHYVDGFRGSVHRSAGQINSSWGWDSDKRRFIPNFTQTKTNKDTCLDGQCQPPFDGHTFGFDSMAGGDPFSDSNRFTLYTPNSATLIQRFFESKAVFDYRSATGFSKWNDATAKMEPYQHTIKGQEQINASVNDLSEARLTALLAEYQLLTIAMKDGFWTKNIQVPAAAAENRGRSLIINHQATFSSDLFINGDKIQVSKGYTKSFTSDGQTWREGVTNGLTARKPERFGIPVTTLVGYYDPQGTLKSYIYPALHGAYGFTYPEDSATISGNDCQLQVQTRDGLLRFKLANKRDVSTIMNKFHINVPTDSQPSQAALVCNNRTADTKTLTPAPTDISYTVHGRALPAKADEGCIVSASTGKPFCLKAGSNYLTSVPDWIYGHEIYVDGGSDIRVILSDWSDMSHQRVAEFNGYTGTEELKSVRHWNGQYLNFSRARSMRVISK